MMSSLILLAFELQETIWRKWRHQRFFLYWDKAQSKFCSEDWSIRLVSNIISFVFIACIPFWGILHYHFFYGLWHQDDDRVIKVFYNVVIYFTLMTAFVFWNVLFIERHEAAKCLNELLAIHSILHGDRTQTKVVKKMGMYSCLLVIYLGMLPILLILCYGYGNFHLGLRIDTMSVLVLSIPLPKGYLHEDIFQSWTYNLLVLAYYYILFTEVLAVASYAGTLLICIGALRRDVFEHLSKRSTSILGGSLYESIKIYKVICVLTCYSRNFNDPMLFSLLVLGYMGFMTFTCINILSYTRLPRLLYLFGLSTVLVVGAFLISVLPLLTHEYSTASDIIRRWRLETTADYADQGKVRQMRKELSALSLVGLRFGCFRKLNYEARKEYLQSLSGRTIDMCLLVGGVIG